MNIALYVRSKFTRHQEYPWWILIFSILFIFHFNHVFNSDEGIVLDGAWNLYNGREIYVNFFALTTPGAYYLICFFWKIFGASFFVANLVSIFSLFLTAIGLKANSDLLFKKRSKFSYVAVFLFIIATLSFPIITYYNFNLLFTVWALFFYLKSLSEKNYLLPFLSGLFASTSFLFVQNKGLLVIFIMLFFYFLLFLKEKPLSWLKSILLFSFGGFLPMLILLAWPVNILYYDLFLFPLKNYSHVARTPYYELLVYFIIFLWTVYLTRHKRSKEVIFLYCLQLIMFFSVLQLADSYHLILAIFPTLILLAIYLSGPLKKIEVYSLFFIFCILFYPSILNFLYLPPLSFIDNSKISYLKANCQTIYAGPFLPNFYFETRTLNPTPYSWLITKHHTATQFEEAAEILKNKRPECAITNYAMVRKYKYDLDNPVDNFLQSDYSLLKNFGNVSIYKLNQDAQR